jgi:tetratricopeptide (TPR) repeat protein
MARTRSVLTPAAAAACLALGLGACATVQPPAAGAPGTRAATAASRPSAVPAASAVAGAAPAPSSLVPAASKDAPWPTPEGMSAELFYRIMLGNVALQRGDPVLAARAFYEAAKEARDADLARRAAEIAVRTRQRDVAEASAKLWLEIDPSAKRASEILAAVQSGTFASGTGDIDLDTLEARLRDAIAGAVASKHNAPELFLELNRALADKTDRLTTFRIVQDLAKPYPDIAEAQFAVALAAANTGLKSVTMQSTAATAIDRALALKPDWDRAALLKSEILANTSRGAAIAYLEAFTKAHPASKPGFGALAQLYVEDKRPGDARTIFERLAKDYPDQREFVFAIGALSFQMKDWPRAESVFQKLEAEHYGENGIVELYLAQIAEEQKRYDEAIARYKAVPEGERAWVAQLRVGVVMAKKGDLAGARKYLDDLPAVTIDQRVEVRQTEAQILRDAHDNAGAYAVLTQALAEHPDSPELLYDAAMVAEKLDKVDESEARLSRLVELKPDDAQALNALGYTLVDRSKRLDEGYALIERALKLAPDDAFILDSMGWALFRMGRLDDSIAYLTRALNGRADPEIAAHLGEVLWAKGEQGRALDVWRAQLKTTPDNPVLLETVKRFSP